MTNKKIHISSGMDKTFKSKLALERGKRIKLTRTLAGLTRKEVFEKHDISPNTMRAWEKGINILTENKASTLVEIFAQEGVNITTEWLLYGEDPGLTNKAGINNANPDLKDAINFRSDLKILDEVTYFLDNNINSVSCLITDESLSPQFSVGDYVGGIKSVGKKIIELVGEFCIIITNDERVFPKKIFMHKEKNFFVIGDINPLANLNAPHHFTCEVRAAAKITRHWCLGLASKKAQVETN